MLQNLSVIVSVLGRFKTSNHIFKIGNKIAAFINQNSSFDLQLSYLFILSKKELKASTQRPKREVESYKTTAMNSNGRNFQVTTRLRWGLQAAEGHQL